MRTTLLAGAAIAGTALLLVACAQLGMGERALRLAEEYCTRTTPAERALVRLQVTTEEGPAIEIHCDRL
jgi:hypothetical protein